MADTTQPSVTDADEIMRLAVERFRTKMESSNRQFLQDRIDEIEAMNLPTEEEKLKMMRPYWPDLGIKGDVHWNDCTPIGPVRQSCEERNVTRLADVRTLYHQYMDGTMPPTLVTDEWRQMYLETVQNLEVKVGFQTGTGCRKGHDAWYSAYLYCRRYVEDSDPSHKDWAWRVVVFQAHGENPTTLYGRKPRFDSIPEFLEWYSSWLEHLDLDQVRKDVLGSESDEDF